MAVCAVCQRELPPGSSLRRRTCGDRCRKRLSRHSLAIRPASMLTAQQAMERLALLDPARYGPLPPLEDDGPPDGDLAGPGQVLARDFLDGLPEDDPVRALLADDHGVLEWLLVDDPAPETRPQAGAI